MSTKESRFEVLGDLGLDTEGKNVTNLYRDHSTHGIKDDERIVLNWRVISKRTGRTMAVMGGPSGFDAANVFCSYCEENY